MFIMQLTTGRRLGALSVAFLLALIGMVWLAPIAGAHHPDITAQPICNDDGSVSIGWTSLSWMQDPTQDGMSGNPDIRIYFNDVQVAAGAYTAGNGYQFSGTNVWPGTATSVVVKAVAVAPSITAARRVPLDR
jgi:hypothetical protein